MDIAVVVPNEKYWREFVKGLEGVLEITVRGKGYVKVGEIKYRLVNMLAERGRYYGLRVDQVIVYKCIPGPQLIVPFYTHGAEVIHIQDNN